jgi:hypothetical protein
MPVLPYFSPARRCSGGVAAIQVMRILNWATRQLTYIGCRNDRRVKEAAGSLCAPGWRTHGVQLCRLLFGKLGRNLLLGMPVGCLRVPVGLLAMVVGGGGVLLGLVMLADFVVVSRLVMVMDSRTVVGRGLVMVLCGGMFALVSHNRSPG